MPLNYASVDNSAQKYAEQAEMASAKRRECKAITQSLR